MRSIAHESNLVVAFVLELVALAALAAFGWGRGSGWVTRSLLGASAPLAAGLLWGAFAAPRAQFQVRGMGIVTKILVFGAAAAALAGMGRRGWAVAFIVLVLANGLALRLSR